MKTSTLKKIAGFFFCFAVVLNANATITNALKVRISNGSISDETVVRFISGATAGFDGSYDAYKIISSAPNVPSLFTNIDSVSHMSINALPQLLQRTDVDLYAYIKTAGTYTFESIELGAFPAGCKIIVEDKQTGMSYPFRNGSTFTLTLAANTIATSNRFTLHFSPAADPSVNTSRGGYVLRNEDAGTEGSIADQQAAVPQLQAFPQDGDMVLNLQTEEAASVTIAVYSISGQLLYNYSNANSYGISERIPLSTSGIYIVNAVINNQVQSHKFNYSK